LVKIRIEKYVNLFLTRDILLFRYQMAVVVGSGCFEIMLRQQVSHLLFQCTDLGYGTLLTAACTRQGCSASDLVWFGFFVCNIRPTSVAFLITCRGVLIYRPYL
jgi:hypothetical protein